MSNQTNGTKKPVRARLPAAPKIGTRELVEWEDAKGTKIALNVDAVRQVLPQGKYPPTDNEILLFLHQARSMGANPFMRDVHLVKYSANEPASIVTSYHHFMRLAKANDRYQGYDLWCIDKDGKRIHDGLETKENVIAAVCLVTIEGYEKPVKFVARMVEFNKRQAKWNEMPVLMLCKCAIGNAHRLADPGLAGMYLGEELGQGYADSMIEGEATEVPASESPETQPETSDEPADSDRRVLLVGELNAMASDLGLKKAAFQKFIKEAIGREDVESFKDLATTELLTLKEALEVRAEGASSA